MRNRFRYPNLRRFIQAVACVVVAAVFTAATTAPAAALTPEEITSRSLYGNWHQYVPGDTPLGVACGAGPGGGPANITVGKDFSLGPLNDAAQRQVNLMKALIRDFGLTPAQAAGPVGNFMHESGGKHLPPDINEILSGNPVGPAPPAFRGGYGWAQWTGPRQRNFIDFAVLKGYMASRTVNATDAANYAYLTDELSTGYRITITQLKTKTTPEDAAVSFEATFEKAGTPALEPRKTNARAAFNAFNGGVGGPAPAPGVPPIVGGGACEPGGGGGPTIVGLNAFPLKTTKAKVTSQNRSLFANGTTAKGGHPYTAFDINADPGTPVVAFLGGFVNTITEDRCPGRMISIYNKESNLTVSYLHLNTDTNTHIGYGVTVTAGQQIGLVGSAVAGCGTPHLHIDAVTGNIRPGCSRNDCPAASAAKFVDIGPPLFTTYQALP